VQEKPPIYHNGLNHVNNGSGSDTLFRKSITMSEVTPGNDKAFHSFKTMSGVTPGNDKAFHSFKTMSEVTPDINIVID